MTIENGKPEGKEGTILGKVFKNEAQLTAEVRAHSIIEKAKLADDWDFYTAYLAYDKIGNKKKAFEYINKAIDKNSKEGSYYYWRAYLYHDFGNRDQACSDMHKAQTLGYDVAPSSIQYYCLY